jgi:hypothetical protein
MVPNEINFGAEEAYLFEGAVKVCDAEGFKYSFDV